MDKVSIMKQEFSYIFKVKENYLNLWRKVKTDRCEYCFLTDSEQDDEYKKWEKVVEAI